MTESWPHPWRFKGLVTIAVILIGRLEAVLANVAVTSIQYTMNHELTRVWRRLKELSRLDFDFYLFNRWTKLGRWALRFNHGAGDVLQRPGNSCHFGSDFFRTHGPWWRWNRAEHFQQRDSEKQKICFFFGEMASITGIIRHCVLSHRVADLCWTPVVAQKTIPSSWDKNVGWFYIHVTISTLVHSGNCFFKLLPILEQHRFSKWDFAARKHGLVFFHEK